MLMAARRCQNAYAEKESWVPHIPIVGSREAGNEDVCLADTRQKGQVPKAASLDLVDALDAEDAGYFSNVGEDGFELAPVENFKAGFDAGILTVGAALEAAKIGPRSADDRSDFRQKSGAVLRPDGKLHREGRGAFAAPLDGNAAFGLVHEVLHVRASAGVHRDAAAAGDVADDVVAGNRIAAFCAIDEQIVVAFDDQRSFAKAEHALDGLDKRRPGIFRFRFPDLFRFAKQARENLPRGIFAKTDGGVEILLFREAVVSEQFFPLRFGNFLEAAAELPGLLLKKLLAHVGGFFAFVQIDPLADLAARMRGLDETEPVPARRVAFARENFNHVAADNHMAQRHHLAVHFCAHALMTDFGMHGIGEIHGSGAPRHLQNAAFGRERVDLDGREIHLESRKKFSRFLQLLRPLDELAHPGDALIVIAGGRFAALVFPVSGDAFLRNAVHFLRADLDLERLAAMEDRGMERLIKVWPRHGDVILEAARDRPPNVMHHAQRGVAASLGVRDHADGEQVIDLLEAALLPLDFAVQRIKAFDARFQFRGNAAFHQLRADGALHFFQKPLVNGALLRDFFLQREKSLRLEKTEGQVLEFAADHAHPDAVIDRRVDVESFARNALLFFMPQKFERAHVVEAVSELDHHDANVIDHGQEHFADVLGLPGFRGGHVKAADLRDAFDQASHVRPKPLFNASDRIFGIFDGIVKKGGGERGGIHAHVGENVGHFKKVRDIGIAGAAELVAVTLGSNFVGAANHPGVFRRPVFSKFFEEFLEARLQQPDGAIPLEA